jgi:hypothetical protein
VYEEFIGRRLTHKRPAVFVQHRQQRRGALPSGLGPAAEFGNAGSALAKENVQESAKERQTGAGGLARGGEFSLAVLVEDYGVVETPLQVVTAAESVFELLAEVEGFLVVALYVEVVAEGIGLLVDGLSAESMFFSDACDGAVASEEGSGGAGDALGKR